ncbi:MAG: hypothetical protein ACK5H2_11620 [Beutenbergiaceae bacterium]
MATAWQQVLAQIPNLNDPQAPFSYAVSERGTIIGTWDVAKIRMLGLTGASSYDDAYWIEVRPTGDGVIDWTEQRDRSRGTVGLGGAGATKSMFRGKSIGKTYKFTAGVAGTSHGEPTHAASYIFDTKAIKDPLFALLEQHGWKVKGFFNRLFR